VALLDWYIKKRVVQSVARCDALYDYLLPVIGDEILCLMMEEAIRKYQESQLPEGHFWLNYALTLYNVAAELGCEETLKLGESVLRLINSMNP